MQSSKEVGISQAALMGRYIAQTGIAFEALFMGRKRSDGDGGDIIEHEISMPPQVVGILDRIGLLEIIFGLISAFALYRLLGKRGFDVIIFDTGISAFIFMVLGGFRRSIIVLEDGGPLYESMIFVGMGIRRYLTIKVSEICKRVVLRRVAGVILKGSQQFASQMIQRFNIESKTLVCAAGIETRVFMPGPSLLKEKLGIGTAPLVLVVGGIEPRKNQLTIVQALPEILQSFPDTVLVFLANGRASGYYREFLSEIVNLGLQRHVIIDKPADDLDTLSEYFRAADVFVLVSFAEGLSRALLMAMSSGTAIIASDIPENREVSRQQDEILYVNPSDTQGISNAVASLLADDARRKRMGNVVRRTARECYDLEMLAELKVKFYSELKAARGNCDSKR